MTTERLLTIEPDVLNFSSVELNRQSSCTIQVSNNTRNNVTFKVMTTSPQKFAVRPNFGTLLPRSTCELTVIMRALREVPSSTQCRERFLIRSVLARPGDSREDSWTQYKEIGRVVEDFRVRVSYISPSHPLPSSSTIPESGSSPNAPTAQERNLNVSQGNHGTRDHLSNFFFKVTTYGFLGLILWYIIMKLLPLLWSLIFVLIMLVMRMIHRIVSDSVEDWVVKALFTVSIHFFPVIFNPTEILDMLGRRIIRGKEMMNALIMKITRL